MSNGYVFPPYQHLPLGASAIPISARMRALGHESREFFIRTTEGSNEGSASNSKKIERPAPYFDAARGRRPPNNLNVSTKDKTAPLHVGACGCACPHVHVPTCTCCQKCHVVSCHVTCACPYVCVSRGHVSHMCIYQKQSERPLSWASLDTMPREIE